MFLERDNVVLLTTMKFLFLKKYIFTCGIWQSTANKYCCIFVYDPWSFKNHFVTITNRKTHFSFITTNFALFWRVLNPEIETVNINIKSKFQFTYMSVNSSCKFLLHLSWIFLTRMVMNSVLRLISKHDA